MYFIAPVICSSVNSSVSFQQSTYSVSENVGQAEVVLRLTAPLECCFVSVTVRLEDVSSGRTVKMAKGM